MKDGISCMNIVKASCHVGKNCVEEIQEMTGAELMSVSRGCGNPTSNEKPTVMATNCPVSFCEGSLPKQKIHRTSREK